MATVAAEAIRGDGSLICFKPVRYEENHLYHPLRHLGRVQHLFRDRDLEDGTSVFRLFRLVQLKKACLHVGLVVSSGCHHLPIDEPLPEEEHRHHKGIYA